MALEPYNRLFPTKDGPLEVFVSFDGKMVLVDFRRGDKLVWAEMRRIDLQMLVQDLTETLVEAECDGESE